MSAKDVLIEAAAEALTVKVAIRRGKTARREAEVLLDDLLAHPSELVEVLIETGVLECIGREIGQPDSMTVYRVRGAKETP